VYIFKAAALAYYRNMPKEKDAKFLISQELALSATVVWPEADLLDGRAMPRYRVTQQSRGFQVIDDSDKRPEGFVCFCVDLTIASNIAALLNGWF
jgi:hypothetical protein